MRLKEDRLCEECCERLPFGRSDAIYCSSACRQKAYRERKRILRRFGDDPDAALRSALDYFSALPVTDSPTESRNA